MIFSDESANRITKKTSEFFRNKGFFNLKNDDEKQVWYGDWVEYQAKNGIYSEAFSPDRDGALDFRKICEFARVFGFFSPSHAYSFQVTFLGIFPILMSDNEKLKKEALEVLKSGGLFAFGVSEEKYGSDLYSNATKVKKSDDGKYQASGKKFYIGNANEASIISVLGRFTDRDPGAKKYDPFIFFALRPKNSPAYKDVKKIETMGVNSAFVGGFTIDSHKFGIEDVISTSRVAWDSVFGTVNLGKFFLGFGSIGMCEHALIDAYRHMSHRELYGKKVIELPHIRNLFHQAVVRFIMMQLYATRALDYVVTSTEEDRRYLLFASVQKAKVSTEGVKTVSLLSECLGAYAFRKDGNFESVLRNIQLIPGLEGSTHINYGLALQFMRKFLFSTKAPVIGKDPQGLNSYLLKARTGGFLKIGFHDATRALRTSDTENSDLILKQMRVFKFFLAKLSISKAKSEDQDLMIWVSKVFSQVVYSVLIAEQLCNRHEVKDFSDVIFARLVSDLNESVQQLISHHALDVADRFLLNRMIENPVLSEDDFAKSFQKIDSLFKANTKTELK